MASDSENEAPISQEEFMKITGLVEDIIVGQDFQEIQKECCNQSWKLFSESKCEEGSSELEKNSKEKFNAFRNYSVETTKFLVTALKRDLGDEFEIHGFLKEVESRTKKAKSILARENASGSESGSVPNSPRGAASLPPPQPPSDSREAPRELEGDLLGMDGEVFEMLLTLRDYALFQEFMTDYAKMMEGETSNLDNLVSLRKLPDEDDNSN